MSICLSVSPPCLPLPHPFLSKNQEIFFLILLPVKCIHHCIAKNKADKGKIVHVTSHKKFTSCKKNVIFTISFWAHCKYCHPISSFVPVLTSRMCFWEGRRLVCKRVEYPGRDCGCPLVTEAEVAPEHSKGMKINHLLHSAHVGSRGSTLETHLILRSQGLCIKQ